MTALAAAIVTLIAVNYRRLPVLRASMDAGANASVLPVLSVASLVGFGSVVAALPAFAMVRDWVLSIEGGPLVSLAVATNVLASLTGSASGGLTIALDALGATYMRLAAAEGIDPALMHRVAVIGAGTLDSLPHNGAVVTLLAVCGSTHRESYLDIVMVAIVGALLGLVAVIGLGTAFGSFSTMRDTLAGRDTVEGTRSYLVGTCCRRRHPQPFKPRDLAIALPSSACPRQSDSRMSHQPHARWLLGDGRCDRRRCIFTKWNELEEGKRGFGWSGPTFFTGWLFLSA